MSATFRGFRDPFGEKTSAYGVHLYLDGEESGYAYERDFDGVTFAALGEVDDP